MRREDALRLLVGDQLLELLELLELLNHCVILVISSGGVDSLPA